MWQGHHQAPACPARREHSGIPSRVSRESPALESLSQRPELRSWCRGTACFGGTSRDKEIHRGVKVGRDHWRSAGPAPLLQQIPSRTLLRMVSSWILSVSRERDSIISPGSLFQALATHTEVLLMFRWNVLLASPARCLSSYCSASQEDSGSILLPCPPCSQTSCPHPSPHPPAAAAE